MEMGDSEVLLHDVPDFGDGFVPKEWANTNEIAKCQNSKVSLWRLEYFNMMLVRKTSLNNEQIPNCDLHEGTL